MMNIRAQSLYRARTLILPLLKRCQTTSTQPNATEILASTPAQKSKKSKKKLNIYKTTVSYAAWKSLDKSPIRKYLVGSYQIGNYLQQRDEARTEDGSSLQWGKHGVPIKFRGYSDTADHVSNIPNIWLRDNCRCEKCVNQDTMQRAFDTFSISPDVMPKTVVTEEDGLRVIWANDNHESHYTWAWLWKHRHGPVFREEKIHEKKLLESQRGPIVWGADFGNPRGPKIPSVPYDEIMADDKGVASWTNKIRRFGVCYVDGCPVSPEKTEELLQRIAFIRLTHYGGFYDFTSDLTMKDTAYTSLALGAHTDTTYFTDPAGLQMFHLLSHTEGEGGASLLVDGFRAASLLKSEAPEAFRILSAVPVSWHASGNEGITITPAKKFPVLNFGTDARGHTQGGSRTYPDLLQVRWNNDDRGVVDLSAGKYIRAEQWYDAARIFDAILKREDSQYWAQLEPGRPVIFDNWRVLHGRSAFTGKRRICGGYINHDDFISRWRNTNFTREEVLQQIL